MSSIFLSHNHTDKPFARQLAQDLQAAGVRVWLDEAEIMIGDSLIEKIRQGIDEMEYVGVILSPNSVNSPWVQREVDVAMNQEIEGKQVRVLPLLLDDCELPGFLKGKLYADFRDSERYEVELNKVLHRLQENSSVSTSQQNSIPAGQSGALEVTFPQSESPVAEVDTGVSSIPIPEISSDVTVEATETVLNIPNVPPFSTPLDEGRVYHDKRRGIVEFIIVVNDEQITCRITIEALRDHFGANFREPLPAFRSNKGRIASLAAERIRQRQLESDGSVLIKSDDI